MSEPRIVGAGFHQQVYDVVRLVPPGRISTYGDIAKQLGSVRVARHVGYALAAIPEKDDADDVPWYRIIYSRGRISFPMDEHHGQSQKALLETEGISVRKDGAVSDFAKLRFDF